MSTRRFVSVHVEEDDDRGGRIADLARGLGAEVELLPSEGGVTTIAGVALPDDAPDWLVEAALLRSLAPGHVLFLCVANSARSQMAEGIGRSLAPESVKISSAGSKPTAIRPLAVKALDEVGVDIRTQRSKGVDEVERPVDAVITLCAEEVCPVWLEDAWRLHWGLPDPAAAEGAEEEGEERLDAFREVRDELRRRLGVLFQGRVQ